MKSEDGQALLEFALVTLFAAFLVITAAALLLGLFAGPSDIGPGQGHNGYSRLIK